MSEASTDFRTAIFAKTTVGQAEIQSRSMGLAPLVRRLLVLTDGKRTGAELEPFAAGKEVVPMLSELVEKGLVSMLAAPAPTAVAVAPVATNPQQPAVAPGTDWLSVLPPAESRSQKELDMARNFMTNTVNNIFGHHNRISLVQAIHSCQDSAELRGVYTMWVAALETNSAGRKRLPELREKLFAVL